MKPRVSPLIAIFFLTSFAVGEPPPLPKPNVPTAQIKGATGHRILIYWEFARDARGHSQYSDALILNNGPDILSEENGVVITPAVVPGAAEYGIVTTRIEAPRDLKIQVGAKGDKTFYYWSQVRNGRTIWSPIVGPVKVEGCAASPENNITWTPTGAEFYYLYRTETPGIPTGWRTAEILAAWSADRKPTFRDKGIAPAPRLFYPAGTVKDKPEGTGLYLLGSSKGEAVIDHGQPLQQVTMYDFNTTDPAHNRFMPKVESFEPSGDSGAYQFDSDNRAVSPTYGWDNIDAVSIHQNNYAGGLNTYVIGGDDGKNTYNGIQVYQNNYTPGQHSNYYAAMQAFGVGDNVMFHGWIGTTGQNRERGDEGSEFFSIHMMRGLMTSGAEVAADAKAGDTYLKTKGDIGVVAAGRGIVNITQAYSRGAARVEGNTAEEGGRLRTSSPIAVGNGTRWTPDMEGWFISLDADTTNHDNRPVRQWYRIAQYLSPTRLRLYAYTYYSTNVYLGQARTEGPYLLCPYTEMADGDAAAQQGLRVAPLQTAWKSGDKIEVIAGPQMTFRLGWWDVGGEFLPQDHVAGLAISYNGNRKTDEGALICYNWLSSLESHGADIGVHLFNTKIGTQMYKETPIVFRVTDDSTTYQLSQNKEGLTLEDGGNHPWVGLGSKGVTLYGKSTIKGGERTRGSSTFSGDGRQTRFQIRFSDPFESRPFIVATPNVSIGMGVSDTGKEGFSVTFASPPAAGKDNIEITWMAQE